MNIIQLLADIGTALSPFAVVISLIYVARQYKRSTDERRVESLNLAIGVHVAQIAHLTATDESSELFRKFCKDFYSLSLNERGVIHSAMLDRTASYLQVHRSSTSGLLDEDTFSAMEGQFISILRTPGGRAWWDAYKHMVPKDLNKTISTAIENPAIDKKPITEEQPWLFEV